MQLISSLNLKSADYFSKHRFISYHHQLRLTLSLGSQVKNVLEIGIFNSLLTDLLRRTNYNVTTADIDPHLSPDIVLDLAQDFTLPENTFDLIMLFQVLEHMPYEQSEQALQRLAAATKKYLIISIPYNTEHFSIQLKLSFTNRPRHIFINIPKFWSQKPLCSQHYWEMGLKDYPKERILNSVAKAGLKVKQEFIDPLNPYHYFLVLQKN
ncbi:class I SAM-dependent methyltransferase [Richelia sinica]|uniref:class I SAM-dependent methyltransferase n=1 Tax=Richelia sinica TaxID=1357545 RepID=UPI00168936CF|nr:methyltransferase domain-containing protein [Richelia sinica]MBD2665439.1 class I SAM-dependent methyltransferase [Richelia sinica FACHB-800]